MKHPNKLKLCTYRLLLKLWSLDTLPASLDLIGFSQEVSDPADLTEDETFDFCEPAEAKDIALTADVVLVRGGAALGNGGGLFPEELDVPVPDESRSASAFIGPHCSFGMTSSSSINTAKEESLSDVKSLLRPSSGKLFDLVNPRELPRLIREVPIVISLS
jgi:hypothetical protein